MTMRGDHVLYCLSFQDAEAINRRYEDARNERERIRDERPGLQAHTGNPVMVGDVFGMVVTVVHSDECINGKVFLDGNDDLWVTSAPLGLGPGNWNQTYSPMQFAAGR
jgi:hypothetical protein